MQIGASNLLYSVQKLLGLQAERDSSNSRPPHTLPSIFPFQIISLKPRESFRIVKQQKERLLASWNEQDLVQLKDQFRNFKNHVSSSSASQAEVQRYSTFLVEGAGIFEKAWRTFYNHFPLLVQFVGGFASVFPGTSTVESDFLVLQWEKDEHRPHLTNLSLEGVLQSKQSHDLLKVCH